jgi:hypothetical protein
VYRMTPRDQISALIIGFSSNHFWERSRTTCRRQRGMLGRRYDTQTKVDDLDQKFAIRCLL